MQSGDVDFDKATIAKVGRHDSFFELGGHSLLAVRVTSLIKRRIVEDVHVIDIFEEPVHAQFAQLLQERLDRSSLEPGLELAGGP